VCGGIGQNAAGSTSTAFEDTTCGFRRRSHCRNGVRLHRPAGMVSQNFLAVRSAARSTQMKNASEAAAITPAAALSQIAIRDTSTAALPRYRAGAAVIDVGQIGGEIGRLGGNQKPQPFDWSCIRIHAAFN